jgi:hypothetical protein
VQVQAEVWTIFFLFFLFAACSEPTSTMTDWHGEWVSSDENRSLWYIGELPSEEMVGSMDMAEYDPLACFRYNQRCPVYGAQIWHDDLDVEQVLFSYSPQGEQETLQRYGKIASVDKSTHQTEWFVDRFDFQRHPNTCSQLRACVPPDQISESACRLDQPHEMSVVSVDGDTLVMWVSDSRNARLLKLRLTKGDPCGEVIDVLGETHPEWGGYRGANGFEFWDEDGVEHMLLSIKDTTDAVVDGGAGKGRIVKWQRSSDAYWHRVWVFPPETDSQPDFLNTPHGVARWPQQDGSEGFLYAHSLGLSDKWSLGHGGTIGGGLVRDGMPVYSFDATIEGVQMTFPRDVVLSSPTTALITDSGSEQSAISDLDTPAAVWMVTLPTATASELSGGWGVSGENQTILTMPISAGPLLHNTGYLFSSDWHAH